MSTITSPSKLDLTGQASEDEPTLLTSRAQNSRNKRKQNQTNNNNNQSTTRDDDNDDDDNEDGILAKYLPNPIDLWEKRTFTSLLLLPFIFILYILLHLPLHYNSSTEKNKWKGRAKQVDILSTELNKVGNELENVKGDQVELKRGVASLRRRLGKMKERRDRRERERIRIEQQQQLEKRQKQQQQQQQQQRGAIAKDGPIANVSMVQSLDVSTFFGENTNLAKKDN